MTTSFKIRSVHKIPLFLQAFLFKDTRKHFHVFILHEIILNHELLTQYTCTLCKMFALEKKYLWLYYTKIEFFSSLSHALLFRISSL